MRSLLRPALTLLALFTLLTGVAYPLVVTAVAQMSFPREANGTLLIEGGRVLGSELIGQPTSDAGLFWGRPSATTPFPDNAASSAASNLGPSNPALREAVAGRIAALRAAGPTSDGEVPVDLVTSSGSGLDPHLSPAAVRFQVPRIARVRGLKEAAVRALVERHVEPRTFGFLGEPRVNVLKLNLALKNVPMQAQ